MVKLGRGWNSARTQGPSARPRLSLFLGAGGVGKTTLSAALAFSLAATGERVGLLSIDPARRLRSALGLSTLGDEAQKISWGKGEVWAAELHPETFLKRWVVEEGEGPSAPLLEHPFFQALAVRLATSSDVFAAARIAEMASCGFTQVVVDTAPGIHAVDFLSHPDKMMAFLDSRLFDWLQVMGRGGGGWMENFVRGGARKLMASLGSVGGEGFLLALADFMLLLRPFLATLATRIDFSREWFRSPEADVFLISKARSDSLAAADALGRCLFSLNVPCRAAVLNHAWPQELRHDPGFVTFFEEARCSGAEAFASYLETLLEREKRAREQLKTAGHGVIAVPLSSGLSGEMRLHDLAELGNYLRMTR